MAHLAHAYFNSPIGRLRLRANHSGLIGLDHENQQVEPVKSENTAAGQNFLKQGLAELRAYFAGELTEFQTPLSPEGTDFQQSVWQQLREIPYGETRCYADIAKTLQNEKAVRAVGLANGRNPLSIFIPCHRVIGKNGKLTGYAGGLEAKKLLLELESRRLFTTPFFIKI
jgi:methylated-DNA-[protein]-cysteine S-methyltransferase